MSPKAMTNSVITAPEGITLKEANQILYTSNKGKLPIGDTEGRLTSLLFRSDLAKTKKILPLASKRSESGQLFAAAAVGTCLGYRERLALLVET
jgi:IMP dehydrogenase